MKFYYLDASAWVKRYYQEKGTTWIREQFLTDSRMVCASLGFIEVWAAIVRKAKAMNLADAQCAEKLLALERDWERFFEVGLDKGVLEMAKEVCKDHLLRGADAVHLASAIKFGKRLSRSDGVILIASDEELLRASKAINLPVINPEEQS